MLNALLLLWTNTLRETEDHIVVTMSKLFLDDTFFLFFGVHTFVPMGMLNSLVLLWHCNLLIERDINLTSPHFHCVSLWLDIRRLLLWLNCLDFESVSIKLIIHRVHHDLSVNISSSLLTLSTAVATDKQDPAVPLRLRASNGFISESSWFWNLCETSSMIQLRCLWTAF